MEANIHILFHGGNWVDLYLRKVLDENTFIWALFEIHSSLGVFAEQVVNLFIVDFNKAAPDQMCFCRIVFRLGDYLTEGPWNDTAGLLAICSSHHGVSFSTASLSVGEDGAIVSVKDTLY